jgi:hypothetical protein
MPFKDPIKRREYARTHQKEWDKHNREKRRLYSANWRSRNPEYARSKSSVRHRERKAFVDWLKGLPCTDCATLFPPVCMDFDHVRGKKVINVGNMLLWNWERFAEEILKCEIVCSNCHRIRTHRRLKERV